jgi:putative phage-type endonuclease
VSKRYEFVKAPQRSPEWLELRRTGLGASDMAAVMGVSPYRTPYQLWAEKTGAVPPQKVGAAANRGVLLEDAVGAYYEQETGRKLRKSNGVVRLKDQPRFMASLDRTIVGSNGIVEIKTSTSPRWSIYPVPPEVVVQTTWQMGIMGAPWCDVAVLLGGLVFKIERVHFDQALFNVMLATAYEFLAAVDSNTAPKLQALDAQAYGLATPQAKDELVQANESHERLVKELRAVNAELHFAEERKAGIEIQLKEAIAENAGLTGNGWTVYWKQAKPSEVTDWKLAAQAAGVLPQVVATYTDIKPGSRRFILKDGGMND